MEDQYRILIVDDEQAILDIYQDYFSQRNFMVELAHDGLEGLAKLRTGEFEVAIVDLQMPGMDGLEVASQVYQDGIDTNIIILTGHGDRDEAIRALNSGVAAWFDKPKIKMQDIFKKAYDLAQVMTPEEMQRILSTIPD